MCWGCFGGLVMWGCSLGLAMPDAPAGGFPSSHGAEGLVRAMGSMGSVAGFLGFSAISAASSAQSKELMLSIHYMKQVGLFSQASEGIPLMLIALFLIRNWCVSLLNATKTEILTSVCCSHFDFRSPSASAWFVLLLPFLVSQYLFFFPILLKSRIFFLREANC